jgi:hypothetical protein
MEPPKGSPKGVSMSLASASLDNPSLTAEIQQAAKGVEL